MGWGDGQERTEEEYGQLLQSSGWRFVNCHCPSHANRGVVEGVAKNRRFSAPPPSRRPSHPPRWNRARCRAIHEGAEGRLTETDTYRSSIRPLFLFDRESGRLVPLAVGHAGRRIADSVL